MMIFFLAWHLALVCLVHALTVPDSGWLRSEDRGGQVECKHSVFRGKGFLLQAGLCYLSSGPKNSPWPTHKCRVYVPALNLAQWGLCFVKN